MVMTNDKIYLHVGNERKLKEVENKWQAMIEKEKMACKQFANKLEAKQVSIYYF